MTLLRAFDNNGVNVSDLYDPDNILDTRKKQKTQQSKSRSPYLPKKARLSPYPNVVSTREFPQDKKQFATSLPTPKKPQVFFRHTKFVLLYRKHVLTYV